MLVSAVLLSGCGSDDSGSANQGLTGESPSKQVTTQPVQNTNEKEKLITASENKNVKLYAVNETDGEVQGVRVDINGKQKEFDWNIVDTGTKPQLLYTDLTGDGKEEAVILIQTGRGTEFNTYDIHVLHAEDLSEIKVPNALDVAKEEVDSKVIQKADALDITVNIQGKEYKTTYPTQDDNYSDKLIFGAINIYSIENQKIVATVAGNVKQIEFVGSVIITYSYDSTSNEFKAEKIEFDSEK